LSDDERNVVYVLSGLPIKGGLDKLAQAVPGISLCAENGCYIKVNTPKGEATNEWTSMVSNLNMNWKQTCLDMLGYYTERTPNSYIDDRGASVVWRYLPGNVTDEGAKQWARRLAAEAQNHIFDSIGERYGLRIVPGETSFLIIPKSISRITAVSTVITPSLPPPSDADAPFSPTADNIEAFSFVLTLSADERLLRRLNELNIGGGSVETVSTSGKNSDAKWRLNPSDVQNLLEDIAKAS